jgi:hypothetical protein
MTRQFYVRDCAGLEVRCEVQYLSSTPGPFRKAFRAPLEAISSPVVGSTGTSESSS